MREYQIEDWVIYTLKQYSDYWKKRTGISLYGKTAKIIYINKKEKGIYLLEFKEYIVGHNGGGKGKSGHCWHCDKNEFKLDIDYLKFKKWVKGG